MLDALEFCYSPRLSERSRDRDVHFPISRRAHGKVACGLSQVEFRVESSPCRLCAVINGPMDFQNLGGAHTIGLKITVILLDKTSSFQAL
jgi:hypothetical protein